MLNEKCKICKEIISLETIKTEAINNNSRKKSVYKDYTICKVSGYCIKCLRKEKKGIEIKQDLTSEEVLNEAKNHPQQLNKALKNKRNTLIKKLRKKGLTKEEINIGLKEFDKIIK